MYPRFVQVFLDKQVGAMSTHDEIFVTPSHTKNVFGNMKRVRKGFSKAVRPLFPTMMVHAQEEMSEEPIADEAANKENVPTHSNNPLLSGEDSLKLNDFMEICTKLQQRFLDLENTKTAQAQEISSLKLRVKRLKKKGGSRTHKLTLKYGLDQCDSVDIPMVKRLNLDKDPNGTLVDPTRYREEGIKHQTSTPRTPKQNDVVERRNRTLIEAARTMLSASKLPLFFWAEAIATACYTQNRSIIIPKHEKTTYHIINDRKPLIKHLHIFGCTCYLTRDGENLDNMKEKGDPCILASDYDNSGPVPQLQNVSALADKTVMSQQELDLLFGPLYDEFFTIGTLSVNNSSSPTDNSKQQDTPPIMNIQSSTEPTTPTNVNAEENNNNQAEDAQFQQDEFINPFCTPV
ncbi:retrovirus-related pol polyprotein from transposon TNT 1-94 [Tanacetum coccineum]